MKILILGGLGFIGTNFISKLIKNPKYIILNIDKISKQSNFKFIKYINKSYKFINLDICNEKKIFKVFSDFKPDLVVNFAAETHVDTSIKNSKNFIQTNIFGTYNLLECSRKYLQKNSVKKFKFIQISTDEVFGDLGKGYSKKSFNEKSNFNPSSPYSASKASADMLVSSWIRTYSFPAIITHTSNNYGPYQYEEKLIPLAIKSFLNKKRVPIYGDGKQKRDWIYVEDNVNALTKILQNGKIGNKYSIGNNKSINNNLLLRKIYNSLCNILPNYFNLNEFKYFIKTVDDRLGHDQHYKIDNSKIINQLNWNPKIDIDRGIKMTCKWYINNKKWMNINES